MIAYAALRIKKSRQQFDTVELSEIIDISPEDNPTFEAIRQSDDIVYSFEFTQEDIDRAPKEIAQYSAPSYIPPQFTMVDEAYVPTQQNRVYLDEAGNVLMFLQCVLWQYETDPNDPAGVARVVGVNAENATVEDVVLQGYEVKIFRIPTPIGTEDMVVVWTDHEYFYSLTLPSVANKEIDRIIGSMTPVEPK